MAGSEGVRLNAYKDVVGIPTVCFGETRNVKLGDKYTLEQCKSMLGDRIIEFETQMTSCLSNPTVIPDKSYAAFLSFTYNVGPGAFCSGSVARWINKGNIPAACDAMRLYNKAGKPPRIIKGLDNRRKEEQTLCLEGVK